MTIPAVPRALGRVTLIALLVAVPGFASAQVSDAQKAAFIALLKTLPTDGEFYADAAVTRAEPYLPVLFALTEANLQPFDSYPFVAISRGLSERAKPRAYAIRHFADIQHPLLKLGWAVLVFNERCASPEMVRFLRTVLDSPPQAALLAEMAGPDFERMKARIVTAANPPIDVVGRFIVGEADRLRGTEFETVRVVKRTGERGAGLIALVALYTIEGIGGGNNYTQFLVAFLNDARGGIRPTKPVEAGGKLYRAVELDTVDARSVSLKTTGYAEKDPACCPTIHSATSYRLAGGSLIEAGGGAGRRVR
jgi:hypothetical protein